jgi:hypothetical protein
MDRMMLGGREVSKQPAATAQRCCTSELLAALGCQNVQRAVHGGGGGGGWERCFAQCTHKLLAVGWQLKINTATSAPMERGSSGGLRYYQQEFRSVMLVPFIDCTVTSVLQISANYAMQGRKRPDDFRGGECQHLGCLGFSWYVAQLSAPNGVCVVACAAPP